MQEWEMRELMANSRQQWGTGDTGVGQGLNGLQILDYSRPPSVFRIISSNFNPYSGYMQYEDTPGVWLDVAVDFVPQQEYLLSELSGISDVPINTRVIAFQNPGGAGWVFSYTGAGTGGSGPYAGGGGSGIVGGSGPLPAPTPRCSGTVYSTTRYRYTCVAGVLTQYSRLETLSYDSAGCLVFDAGSETATEIGCCDCGGSTIVTACCPGGVPSTLYMTVTACIEPALGATPFTVAIVWDGTTWHYDNGVPFSRTGLDLSCSGSAWSISASGDDGGATPTPVSCSPLLMTFNNGSGFTGYVTQ